MALAITAPITMMAGSPPPWGASSLFSRITVSIFGNQEKRGKYTGDGVYNANVWDTQIGCGAMLKAMMALDPTIQFAGATS